MENNVIKVSGNLGAGENNRYVVFYVTNFENGYILSESNQALHFDEGVVQPDGKFEFDFQIIGLEKQYLINVKYGNSIISKPFQYKSFESVKAMINEVIDKTTDIDSFIAEIPAYTDVLGINDDIYLSSRALGRLYTNIVENRDKISNEFLAGKADKLESTIINFKYETQTLNEIKNAVTTADVDSALNFGAQNLKFNLDAYNQLSFEQKAEVCSAIAQKEYGDINALLDALEREIKKVSMSTVSGSNGNNGGGRPSGGGIAGGASGSNSGGIYGNTTEYVPTVEEIKDPFVDLEEYAWAKEAIVGLYKLGIVSGVGDGYFEPQNMVKREEVAKMIAKTFLFSENIEDSLGVFHDVENASWYENYVYLCYKSGIVNGVTQNMFGTGENITRQDFTTMLFRAAFQDGYSFTNQRTDFIDYDQCDDYAKDAIAYMAGMGIINGYVDKSFAPNALITRAEAAKMLYTLLEVEK
ncbi:S-layer homology domain-containing protein [Ructibacterium gallinarum]|uniref:S-layer homology domain-containing protein n=1 Tax=Ructibacterium gallinarum TaxID=2779355 RepID=A0A9D5M250_9FIRM|nr:S-layer homology domain-containing protein [Ructibacterium gallinarum]MBE5040905.1 S-layer homology domain-containing protein [Ructibacterium gallinarum]